MFDSSYFKTNDKLFDECQSLIKSHNAISYKSVSLVVPVVEFGFISTKKVKDLITKDLTTFYETYTSQMIAASKVKTIIENINYSNDDLAMHIDRSSDSILQILSSLTKTRIEMEETHGRIIYNIEKQSDQFIEHIKGGAISDYKEFIETAFICMHEEGLGAKVNIDTNDRFFIVVGTRIVISIFNQIDNEETINLIHQLNDDLKRKTLLSQLSIRPTVDAINRLQTFGITPDDGEPLSIKDTIQKLFGLDINDVKTLSQAMESIQNVLKLNTIDTGVAFGLIVITSTNYDMYFDMSSLMEISHSGGAQGVSSSVVKQFDLIKQGGPSEVKQSGLITINISDKTDHAFVVWSNDLKQFKLRSRPVNKELIRKLLRRSPSLTIQAFNEMLTRAMEYNQTDDDVAMFKRVQYMTFNETITEESFLKELQSRLASAVMNLLENKEGDRLVEAILKESFAEEILDIIDSFKDRLGISRSKLSAHCHIIYASMANKIMFKLKKALLTTNGKLNKANLSESISTIIHGNDNIYTRVIASYYLHVA